MATTRHEPSESVERGVLREDFYYRLAVITIRVPSLRERSEDLPCLVRHLLTELRSGRDDRIPSIEPELMRYFVEHPWPGNIPQLRRCVDTIALGTNAKTLGMTHLRVWLSDPEAKRIGLPPERQIDSLAELERAAVLRALKIFQGSRTQAAEALGISVRTLQRKMRHWGVR
jgi:DNA-binding NtrC family response regulator